METPTTPEYQNLNQNTSPIVSRNSNYKILFFIFLGLFLIVSSVLATLLFTQKKPEISKITEIEEQKIVPTKTTISEITDTPTSNSIPKDWKTYENKKIGFSIQYPAILKPLSEENDAFMGVSFNKLESGSPDTEDAVWEINFNSASNKKTVEEIKKEIGIQFTNKIQNEEIVFINGKINATKITTTTKESPNWYSEEIIIKDTYNNIYVISNRGISDVEINKFLNSKDIKFKDFYSSFKFN